MDREGGYCLWGHGGEQDSIHLEREGFLSVGSWGRAGLYTPGNGVDREGDYCLWGHGGEQDSIHLEREGFLSVGSCVLVGGSRTLYT